MYVLFFLKISNIAKSIYLFNFAFLYYHTFKIKQRQYDDIFIRNYLVKFVEENYFNNTGHK